MNKLRVIDLEELPWQPHPTIGTIMTRVVETAATHPQADVLVANVAPGGAIPWHVHEHSTETVYVIQGTAMIRYAETSAGLENASSSDLKAGCVVTIPAGWWHTVPNTGDVPFIAFAFHTPPTF